MTTPFDLETNPDADIDEIYETDPLTNPFADTQNPLDRQLRYNATARLSCLRVLAILEESDGLEHPSTLYWLRALRHKLNERRDQILNLAERVDPNKP